MDHGSTHDHSLCTRDSLTDEHIEETLKMLRETVPVDGWRQHFPPEYVAEPTGPPPKPSDAAQSVTPPRARRHDFS